MEDYFAFLGEDLLVGHNVIYDYSFLKQWAVNHGETFERNAIDTLKVARRFLPAEQKKDLASLCAYFSIERENAHRALDDVLATAQILRCLKDQYEEGAPDAFAPQPLQYKIKKQTPATPRQIQYLKRYAEIYQLELPDYLDSLTRSEASRMVDQWIAAYGRLPEV
jgi:DNA polymerase-3 subunit alpha (Gram-positive type)